MKSVNLMTNFSWNFDDFGEKYYDFKCTRRTQQINTESKNTEISIFDTK